MGTGAITGYIDVAQITLYLFWIFFAGLIYYLHREDKREGYPLESDRSGGRIQVHGFPRTPEPKTFLLRNGRTISVPDATAGAREAARTLKARATGDFLGAPIEPIGDPMLAGVGPGSYALRADVPDLTAEDKIRIVPLRVARDFNVTNGDPDPRGLPVIGADGVVGGIVRDVWVDRAEVLFRYLEVDVPNGAKGPHVLLPVNFCRIGRTSVKVRSVLGSQLANVPRTKHPDQVTMLEEEKVMAYYGGGVLYATPQRQEPLL